MELSEDVVFPLVASLIPPFSFSAVLESNSRPGHAGKCSTTQLWPQLFSVF